MSPKNQKVSKTIKISPIFPPQILTSSIALSMSHRHYNVDNNDPRTINTDTALESPSTDFTENFHLEKRPRNPVDSCSCPHRIEYEDFGVNCYPRYHKVKRCDTVEIHKGNFNQLCHYGAKCREFHHEIRYLVPMESEGHSVSLLPGFLSRTYTWIPRNISIDCRCGHQGFLQL